MELYVIRHGESEANAQKLFAGWSQIPLTEKGKEQARQTGGKLGGKTFDRIFCSDLCRAKQTAELVFPGREYTEDWRLREIGVGDELLFKYKPECLETYGEELRQAMEDRDYTRYGGESVADHRRRVAEFMDDLASIPDDERIAVVCHEGTIYGMLCYVLKTEPSYHSVEVGNASVTRFRRDNGRWKLIQWCAD